MLVPILMVLGFISPNDYPLQVVTPSKLEIYVLGRYSKVDLLGYMIYEALTTHLLFLM